MQYNSVRGFLMLRRYSGYRPNTDAK